MRRQNSNLNEDIILFLGQCDILTLNLTQQIALATRTLLLKEGVLLTYQSPISSVRQSRLSRNRAPIPLDKLTNHQHQYKITAVMRARLLLGRRDDGVAAYLKELRVDKVDQGSNIVAVINQQERIMHGFLFREEGKALDFFQSLNVAIATQLYLQKLPESLSFNPKIVNLLGEALNGRCCIAPQDFADGRQEQDEIRFVVDFLRGLQGQPGVNFRGGLNELQLRFRVVDETSRDYALRFLQVFPKKVERLVMAGCELNSNILAQLLFAAPTPIADRLSRMQELNLTKGSLTDDAFATLGKLLKSCRRLGTLNLGENSVSFEKEAIIVGFLCSIEHLRLALLLPNNKITSAKHITKYLLNAEGPLPLTLLDISYNPVPPDELSLLTKAYLGKLKQEGFDFRLQLTQLQFQEPQAFQFLQEEYRLRKPNSLAIPVAITKNILRKKGKMVGNTEEDLHKASKIEDLFREYGVQVFRGNFYRLKLIRRELVQLGVTEEVIGAEVLKFIPQKHLQEQMILRKMQGCLNLDMHPRQAVSKLNETIRFCRRKGLSGTAFGLLACIKHRMEEVIIKQADSGGLGRAYRDRLYSRKGRYKAFYEEFFREDYVFHINMSGLLQMTDQQLLKEQMGPSRPDNITAFMTYQYLLSDQQKSHLFLIETCMADPRLSSIKIARFERYNVFQIYQKAGVGKTFLPLALSPEQRTAFLNAYGVQTYRFSDSFIQSGVSSSAYAGMLSRGTVQAQQQRQVLAFIQISKNFLKYLYYTPQQLSEQTLIYLSSITTHLANLQNAHQDPLKLLLVEEWLIHFMTFFDSTRYQPLKPSLLASIAEFTARRVALPLDLLRRLAAFVMRSQGGAEGKLLLHCATGGQPWEGKVDWRPADLHALGGLVLSRGRVQVRVADAAHPELVVGLQVDELATVLDLWGEVKSQVERLNEVTNISQENIDYYWLFTGRVEGQPLRPLTSFQHVGKLVFQQGLDCIYLRRVLFRPEEHSLDYLSRMKYEELLAIYEQGRESFRLAAGLMLFPEVTLEAVMLAMWTDILLADELMLGDLRKREDPQSQARYTLQRERIVGDCLSRLYSRYVPVGFTLDETSRNNVIFDIKSRQMGAAPKNFNQAIKATILSFLGRVGTTAFTTVLPSSAAPSYLYLNNQQLIFIDKALPEPKVLRAFFRNIICFDLTAEGDIPILRFSVAEGGVSEQLGVHSFSIQGDSVWIGQCFVLICQVARNRLSYPPDLLFANEDELNGLSDCPVKTHPPSLISFPLLALEQYFSLTLPRQEVPRVALVPPPSAPATIPPNNLISQPNQQQPPKNGDNKGKLSVSDPLEREPQKQGPPANSLGFIPDRDSELQQIVKSAGQVDVVTSRRSSNKSKDAPRRKSRNR